MKGMPTPKREPIIDCVDPAVIWYGAGVCLIILALVAGYLLYVTN